MNRLALQLSKCLNKNKSILAFNSIRYIASKPTVTNTNNNNVTQSNPVNELDKPQWERSDRYRIFYGFNQKDEAEDKASAHFFTWAGVFFFICLPFVLIYYYPDYKQNDWCWREAHLELARREKAGEPLVSPDLIPVDRIKLPTDQEIGDTEIVI